MSDLPFQINITPGSPAYEQVIQAVHRALASDLLKPNDPFPSVRALSKAVRINPNTAHKVIQHLVNEGTLVVLPGRGTLVADTETLPLTLRLEQIRRQLDQLAIEASRLGFTEKELLTALKDTWKNIQKNS
ncbi:MAG: GntR family transcriptional regulator [Verrucomicrobiaceae bacterium]